MIKKKNDFLMLIDCQIIFCCATCECVTNDTEGKDFNRLDESQPHPSIFRYRVSRGFAMALKEVICVLFIFFAGSAKSCTWDSDCNTWSNEKCCSDSICRETCYYCSYDYQCGTGEVCCNGNCQSSCYYTVWNGGVIAGTVIGVIIFFAIIISIIACCCCACCPYYRHRHPGTVVVAQPGYQPFVSTQTTSTQHMQHYPPPGSYNPPQPGYSQPPLPYTGYPQPPPQYTPAQAQGQPPMPPVSAGQPAKQ